MCLYVCACVFFVFFMCNRHNHRSLNKKHAELWIAAWTLTRSNAATKKIEKAAKAIWVWMLCEMLAGRKLFNAVLFLLVSPNPNSFFLLFSHSRLLKTCSLVLAAVYSIFLQAAPSFPDFFLHRSLCDCFTSAQVRISCISVETATLALLVGSIWQNGAATVGVRGLWCLKQQSIKLKWKSKKLFGLWQWHKRTA